MRYYVHGAGRSGRDAWPQQVGDSAVFADHAPACSTRDKATLVCQQAPDIPYAVVAHSLGALVAVLAIQEHGLSPSHLVLVEPALYDLARGNPAVEAHIEPMTRARDKAATGDLFDYWAIVKPMMFSKVATRDDWPHDQEVAARLARQEPPWGHPVDASFVGTVPTLVVTGGWNAEYEAIAKVLSDAGAAATVLPGSGHRVQDHPDFEAVLEDFLVRHSGRARWI